jgi:hypothetical protein
VPLGTTANNNNKIVKKSFHALNILFTIPRHTHLYSRVRERARFLLLLRGDYRKTLWFNFS